MRCFDCVASPDCVEDCAVFEGRIDIGVIGGRHLGHGCTDPTGLQCLTNVDELHRLVTGALVHTNKVERVGCAFAGQYRATAAR